MKKVLVFGITDNPGGVESVIMNYYRKIDKNVIQFDFLCNTDIVAYKDEIISLGGKIYNITARSKDISKYKNEMEQFFKEHSNEYNSIWVNVCSLANIDYLKYAKKYGIKKRIIHAHNSKNMDNFFRGILHKINKLIIKKYATDFWSCSYEASKFFYSKNIMESSNYIIINNAIDCNNYKYNESVRNEYRTKMNISDKLVFCNVGRLHFQKNQEFVIKVFKEINNRISNSILFLVGEGPDREKLEALVDELHLKDSVIFLGVRNDIHNIMQACDILLFPSLFEGLPLVLVEAQASDILIFSSEGLIDKKILMNKKKLKFISLQKNYKEWADAIVDEWKTNYHRTDSTECIIKNGFDLNTEIKKIEKLLI